MSPNPVVFWELASHNAEATCEFLKAVFDWDLTLDKGSGIWELPSGEDKAQYAGGGVFTLKKARLPFLTLYIRVDDIEDKAQRVKEHGGLITIPIQDSPGGGKICLFNEPSGVTLAMYQRPKAD